MLRRVNESIISLFDEYIELGVVNIYSKRAMKLMLIFYGPTAKLTKLA